MRRLLEAKVNQLLTSLPFRLHARNDLHLMRKAWHMTMGMTIAYLYLAGMSRGSAVVILACILGWDLAMETARLRVPAFNEKIMRIVGPLMRSCEVDRISGIPHYLASCILAIGLFPRPVAILSILFLAVGDPIASLMGIRFGHHGPRFKSGKSLIGTASGVATCMILAFVFMRSMQVPTAPAAAVAMVGGLAGGTAELLPVDLDDNFTIPVVSGFALWLSFMIFGV